MSKKVYLCPSNQWANLYAYGGTNEGTQMNVVADFIQAELENYDVTVLRSDNALNYKQHCEVINGIMPDLCICIHSNAHNRTVTGTETLFSPAVKGSKEFAQIVQNKVTILMPSNNRGIFNGTYPFGRNIGYMNRIKCVNALVEVEYHDVARTAQWIYENKLQIAHALTNAIVEYLGLQKKYVAPVVTPTATKSNETLALEVIAGAWGSGQDRKNSLTSAGYDYSAVQAIVNQKVQAIVNQKLNKPPDVPQVTYLTVSTAFMPLILNSLDFKKKLASMSKGSKVELVERGSKWTKVKYNGLVGYAATQYLK